MKDLDDSKIEVLNKFIDEMSYYNAAEGSNWSKESTTRSALKSKMYDTLNRWLRNGLDINDLKEFHSNNRQLTTLSDLLPHAIFKDYIK